jgi:hypothetical protein
MKSSSKRVCPVEPYAREIASLIRLQSQTGTPEFADRTNLGANYASGLMQERIQALATLASFETPQSVIGFVFQLFLARCAMPVSEIPRTVSASHPAEMRAALSREDFAERNIMNALAYMVTLAGEDPDIATLESRYGEDPDDGRPNIRVMQALAEVA